MHLPPLETDRLIIRPFARTDLDAIYQILDVELATGEESAAGADAWREREQWLQWTVLNYGELTRLHQPPYGDRAIVLKTARQLIGACGFVPCLDAFGQLPAFAGGEVDAMIGFTSPEVGLYWAIAPAHQRRGYATEAAGALIEYAFTQLRLRRIVATTAYDNAASIGVMRRLGMRIERNPYPEPPWLQIVGVLDNNRVSLARTAR